jgi:hypothetical protein
VARRQPKNSLAGLHGDLFADVLAFTKYKMRLFGTKDWGGSLRILFAIMGLLLSTQAKADLVSVNFVDLKDNVKAFASSLAGYGYSQHPLDQTKCLFEVEEQSQYLKLRLVTIRGIKELTISPEMELTVSKLFVEYSGYTRHAYYQAGSDKPFLELEFDPSFYRRVKLDTNLEFWNWAKCEWSLDK